MKYTLIIPEKYIVDNDKPYIGISKALSYDCFDRCEVTLLSSSNLPVKLNEKQVSYKLTKCMYYSL